VVRVQVFHTTCKTAPGDRPLASSVRAAGHIGRRGSDTTGGPERCVYRSQSGSLWEGRSRAQKHRETSVGPTRL